MPRAKPLDTKTALRDLPSVDELVRSVTGLSISLIAGANHATTLSRIAIGRVRLEIVANTNIDDPRARAEDTLAELWTSEQMTGIRRVINATGVIIHTNLGRAPLSEAAREAIVAASGSANLEYSLETGKRGRRGSRVEQLLIELTGAEDAIVVNNCAAAAFFVLTVFAAGGEVVISRGELVEIGGDFRVPDVLQQSGAKLREVGTTNRTKLADYEKAIGKDTRMLLRVHPSNYRIVGFTETPTVAELANLARKNKVLLFEDIGSGALIDLSEFGLADEPVVSRSISDGADLVSFSGDKLLGGLQAGIIAGKRELIEKLRKHPLHRALRVDKITLAALEATLDSYQRGKAIEEIPVLRALAMTSDEVRKRAEQLIKSIGKVSDPTVDILDGKSVIGGGAAPAVHPKTALIAISHKHLSAEDIERRLRMSGPPVIARIEDGRVLIDLRTVDPVDEPHIAKAIKDLA
jgi:L-seryl-tRNA(Ser) seleniumtransferase